MVGDEPVSQDEAILRRFNPADESHVKQDEGTGDYFLRSGAFYLRSEDVGHSCHRRRVLDSHQLPIDVVRSPPTYIGLAEARVATVESCDPGWEVRPDPWPDGYDASHPEDVAHSLVVPAAPPKKPHTRQLVSCFSILSMY